MSVHDESLYEDLFEENVKEPEERLVKNEFFAWHHPRKHLVRMEQWLHYIKEHKESIIRGSTLKYLGLPGDDLLDIRVIHDEFCTKNNITLKFIGFNDHTSDEKRTQNANLSFAEVRAMAHISPESIVIDNDILHIGEPSSLAYERVKDNGNYDVVNLDFCDSIAIRDPQALNHYNLLTKILQIQSNRDNPWLLFITTRIGKEHVNDNSLKALIHCFESNLKSACFSEKSAACFGISNSQELDEAIKDERKFNKVIITAFCKWMLTFCLDLNPKTTMKVLDSMEYKVNPKATNCDMVSFALLLKPHPESVIDRFKLASHQSKKVIFSESEIASHYIYRFNVSTNCDTYLQDDKNKKEEMIKQSIKLLNSARYDTSSYRDQFT
ncbi:hypothetical protein SMQE13_46560 [Serratia marcescens]|nr:hypothetical protein SMQE13_46560 [Serratia marcescens]